MLWEMLSPTPSAPLETPPSPPQGVLAMFLTPLGTQSTPSTNVVKAIAVVGGAYTLFRVAEAVGYEAIGSPVAGINTIIARALRLVR